MALGAFRRFGMDASIVAYGGLVFANPQCSTSELRVEEHNHRRPDSGIAITERTVHTPGGTLTERREANAQTQRIVEPLVKYREDALLVRKYAPVPILDPEPVNLLYRELGHDGSLRGFVLGDQGGPWQEAFCLCGT